MKASPERPSQQIPLQAVLAEIRSLGADADPHRRIELLRQTLARQDVAQHAELQAALYGMLGSLLASLSEQTGSDHYDEAIASFEAALRYFTRESAPDSWLVTTFNLGKVYARRGARAHGENIEKAIGCFTEVLDAGPRQLPVETRTAALNELAQANLDCASGDRSDNIERTVTCCHAVLDMVSGTDFPASALERAKAHRVLGRAYLMRFEGVRTDNVERAIENLKTATNVFTHKAFPDEWAGIQCDLGTAFRQRVIGIPAENLERSIGYFERARTPDIRELHPVTYVVASTGIGETYLDRVEGDPAENVESAISCLVEARKILADRGLIVERAAVQHDLGNAYIQRHDGNPIDNVELAIGCLQDAQKVRTEKLFPLDWAATQHALGNAYLYRGREDRAHNVEQAIIAFRSARDVFAAGRAARQEAVAQQSLAQAYFSRVLQDRDDNVALAISSLEAALTIFRAQGMIIEQASVLTALGNAVPEREVQDQKGTIESAIDYQVMARETLGSAAVSPATWGVIQNNLGVAYLERHGTARQQDIARAIDCFEDSLAVKATTRTPMQMAMTRYNLGAAYAERAGQGQSDDLHKAITHFEAALEVFKTVGSSFHRRGAGHALGDAYARLGEDWPSAFRAYQTALDAADELYVSSIQRDAREAELAETTGLHQRAAYAAAEAGKLEHAVAILERGRARGLGDGLARDLTALQQVRERDDGLADAFDEAARQLRMLEATEWRAATMARDHDADRALLREEPGARPAGSNELRHQLEAARTRLARAIADIRRLGGKHERFLVQPEFPDIAAAVSQAGPVAYLTVGDVGSLTLLVAEPVNTLGPDGRPDPAVECLPRPTRPLTSAALRSLLIHDEDGTVTGGYLPAQMEMSDSAEPFKDALGDLLPVLGELLTGPLAERLTALRTGRITLIACGLLGLLPLHAATYRREGNPRCLLDDFAVTYQPSARVLDITRAALSAQPVRSPVLAGVGDPAGPAPLEFARTELQRIAAHFPTAVTFYGEEATKPALLDAARNATHVHLACHGSFDPVAPLESALLLAGNEKPDPLMLREILADRPFSGARLVVASACETAITDFTRLPDEVIGLHSGILQGGTPGVVGTLWKVHDKATALLMIRFYEYQLGRDGLAENGREPMSPAEALRQAQLWLAQATRAELNRYLSPDDVPSGARAATASWPSDEATAEEDLLSWLGEQARPFAHPWYWASFVFMGT